MAIEYAPIDTNGVNARNVAMIIRADPGFVDDEATRSNLSDLGKNFPFQVPPRVTADTKSAKWEESDVASYEPIAIWRGAKARAITLVARYVVDGGAWPGSRIANLASTAKAYFYRSMDRAFKGDGFGPIVEIRQLYDVVGGKSAAGNGEIASRSEEGSTWRMADVGIARSENYISEGANGDDPAQHRPLYPLWTEITFNLLSYTQIGEDSDDENTPQKVIALRVTPTYKWF